MDLWEQRGEDNFNQVQEICIYLVLYLTFRDNDSKYGMLSCHGHSLGAQSLMSVSQVRPVYPALHEHTKPPSVLVQVPRFLQGFEMHSFTSMLHN